MNSGDELGGFDPTTPRPPPAQNARARQPSNRAVAGPSKASNTQASKASSSKNSKEEAIILYSEEDDELEPTPPPAKPKPKPVAAPPAQTNGKVTKGKGKAKEPETRQSAVNEMAVDGTSAANGSEPAARPKPRPTAKAASKPQPPARPKPGESHKVEALERENSRLKKRLEDLTAIHETSVKQLQESFQVRHTDPEKTLQDTISQFEATIHAQEKLLEEQSRKLAQYGAAPQSGPSVQFLTRDAVDAEKKALEAKLRQLEETVKKKDAQITELQQKQHDLDKQLEYEIKLASEYRAKNPPAGKANGGPRAAVLASPSDPIQAEVTKLYEDFSNVLVTKVTAEPPVYPQWPDLKQYTFNCTYTHVPQNPVEGAVYPSIQFSLRTLWLRQETKELIDEIPPKSKDELFMKCQYWPVNLDKETEQFREQLDFFAESFIFSRDQMSVFFKTLAERLASTLPDNETEEEVEAMVDGK